MTIANGKKVPALIESSSAANDIAVLRVAASISNYLFLVSSQSASIGEQVFTIGFPTRAILGSEAKFTEGSISALTDLNNEASKSNWKINRAISKGIRDNGRVRND